MSSDRCIVGTLIPEPSVCGVPRRKVKEGFLPRLDGLCAADLQFVELPPECDRVPADIRAIVGLILKPAQQGADPFEHAVRDTHEPDDVAPPPARWRRVSTWRCGSLIQPTGRSIASNAQNLRQ